MSAHHSSNLLITAAALVVVIAGMQAALDVGGIITVITPGTYEVNATLQIGSDTALLCSPGVIFKKTGDYCNVIINKGALTKTYNAFHVYTIRLGNAMQWITITTT